MRNVNTEGLKERIVEVYEIAEASSEAIVESYFWRDAEGKWLKVIMLKKGWRESATEGRLRLLNAIMDHMGGGAYFPCAKDLIKVYGRDQEAKQAVLDDYVRCELEADCDYFVIDMAVERDSCLFFIAHEFAHWVSEDYKDPVMLQIRTKAPDLVTPEDLTIDAKNELKMDSMAVEIMGKEYGRKGLAFLEKETPTLEGIDTHIRLRMANETQTEIYKAIRVAENRINALHAYRFEPLKELVA